MNWNVPFLQASALIILPDGGWLHVRFLGHTAKIVVFNRLASFARRHAKTQPGLIS
jgi:hypothetical protein